MTVIGEGETGWWEGRFPSGGHRRRRGEAILSPGPGAAEAVIGFRSG